MYILGAAMRNTKLMETNEREGKSHELIKQFKHSTI